jgi:hypothetical protein
MIQENLRPYSQNCAEGGFSEVCASRLCLPVLKMFEQMLDKEPIHLKYFDPTAHVLDKADAFPGLRRL